MISLRFELTDHDVELEMQQCPFYPPDNHELKENPNLAIPSLPECFSLMNTSDGLIQQELSAIANVGMDVVENECSLNSDTLDPELDVQIDSVLRGLSPIPEFNHIESDLPAYDIIGNRLFGLCEMLPSYSVDEIFHPSSRPNQTGRGRFQKPIDRVTSNRNASNKLIPRATSNSRGKRINRDGSSGKGACSKNNYLTSRLSTKLPLNPNLKEALNLCKLGHLLEKSDNMSEVMEQIRKQATNLEILTDTDISIAQQNLKLIEEDIKVLEENPEVDTQLKKLAQVNRYIEDLDKQLQICN
jgi:hypothetical protein